MNIQYSQFKKLNSFLLYFFPDLDFERRELDQENTDILIQYLAIVTDALFKGENLYKKRNLILPEGKSFFTRDIVDLLSNISLFLYKFESQVFNFTRTERQTFIFIIENVIDYFKRCRFFVDKKDRQNLFVDYRFWLENFFKMFNQKISGTIFSSKKLNLKNFFNTNDAIHNELIYSSPAISFSISPFAINRDNRTLFLIRITDSQLVALDVQEEKETILKNIKYDLKVYEFLFANFEFHSADLFYDKLKKERHVMLEKREIIRNAWNYHKERLYQESYNELNSFAFETLEMPLLYLLQIRNMVNTNRVLEVKKLLQKYIQLFPYYPDGYEILGDIHLKEEDYDQTLFFYEKVLRLTQNKRVAEKIKKVREIQEKNKDKISKQKNENLYDLTELVFHSDEKLLPRPKEERQIVEILLSETRRSAILVGEKGVGKSALVRRMASKILNREVPAKLNDKRLKEINFVTLLTGSKYRGQFEEKVLKLLEDFKSQNAILVLEDVHLMISTGVPRGTSMDMINILKAFLKEKSIQVIATTSYEEYKNTIEKDNTLMGFFQKITVNEMSVTDTRKVLRNLTENAFTTDNIIVPEDVIELIIESARRDIREKKCPDAAVMIFDRALAKVKYKMHMGEINKFKMETTDVTEVLSDMLNLPETNLPISLKQRLLDLNAKMCAEIVGQNEAIERITTTIITAKMNFDVKKERPDGVFLFIGPTGVGKTESAIALTKALYGSIDYLIRIDMSEYMEKYTYSRFVGAAPGYVGYMDANQLTDRVRQNPYSVILLDEIEKADSQLLNIFLQVFDAGRLTDARGNVVDFSHTTIIMTSNIGTNLFSKTQMGYHGDLQSTDVSHIALLKALKKYFSPEFLNRVDEVLMFNQLTEPDIRTIIDIQLKDTRARLEKEEKELIIHEDVMEYIIKNGYSKEYGARHIARTLRKLVLEKIAMAALDKSWDETRHVICSMDKYSTNEEILVQLGMGAIEQLEENKYINSLSAEHS